MNMKASVSISLNGTAIDWHELDNSIPDRLQALLHARNVVGFANSLEEDQSSTPLEVTMDLSGVPLATINDPVEALELRGVEDGTVFYYNDAMGAARDKLAEAVEGNPELLKALGDCTLGQLFLVLLDIKDSIDGDADKKE